MFQKSRRVLAPGPGNSARTRCCSREYNIGSVAVCPVLLWQQMGGGGAADDHLHDIQWLLSSSYLCRPCTYRTWTPTPVSLPLSQDQDAFRCLCLKTGLLPHRVTSILFDPSRYRAKVDNLAAKSSSLPKYLDEDP